MSKNILLALILLFSSIFTLAQKLDSLLLEAIEIVETDSASSISLFYQALQESDGEIVKLEIYDKYCFELQYLSKLDLLYQLTDEALETPINQANSKVYLRLLKMKFDVFNLRKEYDSVKLILIQLYELGEQYQDTTSMITSLVEQASFYEILGDYGKTLDYNFKALEVAEKYGKAELIALGQLSLAIFYDKIDKERESIRYNKEALKTYALLGTTIKMAQIYNNIGLAYDGLNMYDSARFYFEKGYAIAVELGSEFGKAVTKLNLGLNAYRNKDYQNSIETFKDVLQFFSSVSDDYGICLCYYNLCRIYNDLNQHDQALTYGLKGYNLSKENNFINEVEGISKELSEVYEKTNNSTKALFYFKEYVSAKDSLFNEEKNQEIGRLESQFELNKSLYENQLKEKENLILKEEAIISEQKIRTQGILIIGAIIIVVLLLVFAILLRNQLRERKILLKKIEGQAAKLKELDQAKTRFFANISHDLRSPLTLILGSLDKITERDYEVLDKESKDLLETGIKNGKRLLYLADEIMDLTRLEEGKVQLELQYVKIVPYLRLLTKMFSSAADIKSIELKFTSQAEDETTLQIDPHQFEKIIYNLLSNGIKFTPERGVVDVELGTDKNHLKISIADSGPGIPKESLDLIFDRYYQSSEASTSLAGVGIGLALVKELVELHGGSIEAVSNEKGSVFTIRFPFKKNDWISKAIVPERSLDVVTKNSLWMDLQDEKERLQIPGLKTAKENAKAVLIVEDHKELRSYLQSILSSDYRVYLAANGSSALDILQSEKIDLILTDLMMPYMDGFELVDHLKKDKELKKIPVVVVSARTDKKEKLNLISKGAEDVISKPFDKEELVLKIQNILERDWDSSKVLSKLYGETAEEFEKNIMHRLESLIVKRIDDPHLSVLDLADEMAASERKVYRLIKKISGLTPYELIKEVRWQYLDNYLNNNKVRTATEAAQLIGMNNVSSFASQYEKRFKKSFKEVLEE
ncbi:response regulator [Ekhidna sp.]|uniref:response regulator n=1 Tax=Ekhidna sp. TaxID=2608089 RepID=UPI003B502C37